MQFSNVAWSRPPSYLDARNFSSAFWQVLASAHLPALPASAAQALPNVAPATDSATALAQLVVGAPNDAIKHLEAAVQGSATIPDALRAQVLALLAAAQSDYGRLLAATDGWFNAQMDRVSGWYKRQSQWVMVVIALLVTTVSGIDTRDVIRTLSATDPCVLAQYAQQAGDMAQQSAGNAIPVPKGCTGAAAMAPLDVTNFAHVGFPNWTYEKDGYLRWPGMLLTLVALTLGGPFWFDALKALVNVRSAGRKPERTDQPPQ
ncbi:MAG: hypothetical protein JOZ24_04775 [Candidatus Eremiobacteraeota bacterium]|nr:hypothetical protein [Candidatus Eremiobacteraeota bacterium]